MSRQRKAKGKWWMAALLMFLLTACLPNKILDTADAYAVTSKAKTDALEAAQSRQQDADLHQVEMKNKQYWADVREATSKNMTSAANGIVWFAGWALRLSLAASILGIGVGVAYAGVGTGKAWSIFVARRAIVRGAMLPMDVKTMSYPALPIFMGNNIVAITDPTTQSTLLVDVAKNPDKLLGLYAGMTRRDGKIAFEAKQATDANGVTNIVPAMIDIKELFGSEVSE